MLQTGRAVAVEHEFSGKGLFLSLLLTFKIAGGPIVTAGMWPLTG
jgi:hypothetical protein